MRPLARYALTSRRGAAGNPADLGAMSAVVGQWLKEKGWDGAATQFQLPDGRTATVENTKTQSRSGQIDRWSISEPTEDRRTQFRTQLALAERAEDLAVYCELSAALVDNALAPLRVEARCPTVIRMLMGPGSKWFYGSWRLASTELVANGREQGEVLVGLLRDASRPLPIVVISSRNGLTLQPGIAASIASDLAGLATVVQADEEAMWQVSYLLGREWSCYLGAIRLYWPLPIPGSNPVQHPLWTTFRLLGNAFSVDEAAGRLRNYLRGRLMAVSVFAVARPDLIGVSEAEFAQEQRDHELARVRSTNDWQELDNME